MTKPHQPWFIRTPTPPNPKKIHLIGIAGSAMGAFACMLDDAGFEVRGSDQNIYPPMSDTLASRKIPVMIGQKAEHLEWNPDWIIIGNVCRRDHPEVLAAQDKDLPYSSFPQALCDLFLESRFPIIIAGTHGKTTTTTLTAWLLSDFRSDTGFLVGGQGGNFEASYRIGQSKAPFVIEGDEYDTAFFDKGPKFLHYRPEVAVLNNVEFDHADIYDSIEEIEENFERLCDLITPGKTLWVNGDDQRALHCARKVTGTQIIYGFSEKCQWRAIDVVPNAQGCAFTLISDLHPDLKKGIRIQSPLAGRHNVWNTLVALGITLVHENVPLDHAIQSLSQFKGVEKRQQELGEEGGILVMDDYAHHPTAIKETILALKARYPQRRLWAIYEPKSNTARRNIHQNDYAEAFAVADAMCLTRPFKKQDRFSADERLDLDLLVADVKAQGVPARACLDIDTLVQELTNDTQTGDLLVFMSSSSFEGAPRRLLACLKDRFA